MPTKIFCGTYLNNGKIFLSASQDRVIRCFKITNQYTALVRTILARDVGWSILDVAISPDEKYIAYSSWCNSCKYLQQLFDIIYLKLLFFII